MKEFLIVIPARYGSVRFPAKVLAPLGGRPVLAWCHRAAVESRLGPVLVATDDRRVAKAVKDFGGTAVMTPKNLVSGTDRVHAAVRNRSSRYVINLQGDEPLITPNTLRRVADLLKAGADMATAVTPLDDAERARSRNVVKAALGKDGRALYFSRAPIPSLRSGAPGYYQHIGIYGFKRSALRRFVGLKPSNLERAESLEQLRALEDGLRLHAAVVNDVTVAIDTPADLRQAEEIISQEASHD